MKPIFYYLDASPSCRSSLLTIKALGIEDELEFKIVNMMTGDHLKPEFLKVNPLHTLPTLVDGDLTIRDSHVINAYLVEKFGKSDDLYPKDLNKRVLVDQALHYDSGVLFARFVGIGAPILRREATAVSKSGAAFMMQAYESMELILSSQEYMAADHLTIADFSAVSTISTVHKIFVPITVNKFPKLLAWIEKLEQLPYYQEANQVGLEKYVAAMKQAFNL